MRERVYNHFCDLRSLLYLLDCNNLPDTPEINEIIDRCQDSDAPTRHYALSQLRTFCRQTEGEKTIRELRDRAAQLGVRAYSRLSKIDLLSEIRNAETTKESQSQANIA